MDGCRRRTTPPSLRFLGRHVYLVTVVTVTISALMLGTTPSRLARLSVIPGLDRRTLARWRVWWRSTFTDRPFAAFAKAALVPPIDGAATTRWSGTDGRARLARANGLHPAVSTRG